MKNKLLHVFFILGYTIGLIKGEVKITPKEHELFIKENGTGTLNCTSNNGPVQWSYPRSVINNKSVRETETNTKTGLFSSSLTISSGSHLDTGYYKCHLKNNNSDSAKIYVYSFDDKNILSNESLVLNITTAGSNFTIPCKPTFPDVNTTLSRLRNGTKDVKIDAISKNAKDGYVLSTASINGSAFFLCTATYQRKTKGITFTVHRNSHTDAKKSITTTTRGPYHNVTSPVRPTTTRRPSTTAAPVNSKSIQNDLKYIIIIGIGITVFVVLCLLMAVIWICLKKRNKPKTTSGQSWEQVNMGEYFLKVSSTNSKFEQQAQHCQKPNKINSKFPKERLELGKILGSGAFGLIKKAEAIGIMEEGMKTVVVVKIYNCQRDTLMWKALEYELKVMTLLPHHTNIANLLGACTEDLEKGELAMILEYCKYGNLRDFILDQRNSYLKQLRNNCEIDFTTFGINEEQSEKKENQRISILSQGMKKSMGSQECLISNYKNYDPDWHLNYCRDCSDRTTAGELIKDVTLISWLFQIAKGMQYLASLGIVHGDLAARNILLAEGNIVKISNIGLSKIMYECEDFQNKKIVLPVKWMAIESITDKEFTTQSDVWSFGVTAWELFSFETTPYHGLEHAANLCDKLESGYRLEKPNFASTEIYTLMKDCWQRDPKLRPTFTKLSEKLGNLLEESIRTHHTNLKDIYEKTKADMGETENYLRILNSYKHPTPTENRSTLFDNPAYLVVDLELDHLSN